MGLGCRGRPFFFSIYRSDISLHLFYFARFSCYGPVCRFLLVLHIWKRSWLFIYLLLPITYRLRVLVV